MRDQRDLDQGYLLNSLLNYIININNKHLFFGNTLCLSLLKKESKYNPMARHHVPQSIVPKEELPFRRLNVPIYLHCGSLYSWWGSNREREVPDVMDTLTYLRVRVMNPFLYYWV
jgi:hypothetical protein